MQALLGLCHEHASFPERCTSNASKVSTCRSQALLGSFPEHAILEQLLLVSQRLLSLPLDSPLGRLLVGLQLLHRKALEWESYAAKHVSIREELTAIEAVIMRWHRVQVLVKQVN